MRSPAPCRGRPCAHRRPVCRLAAWPSQRERQDRGSRRPPDPRPGRRAWPGPGPASRPALTALLRPKGLPPEVADRLEAAFGAIGQAGVGGPGPDPTDAGAGADRPARSCSTGCRARCSSHPAPLYDREGVELLASRQTRSIATAVGALQVALVTAAAASTLEGGPVLALAIDGVVGQVASVVHGTCDWYNTGSYLVRRLRAEGIVTDRAEVRRLTNAALMSKGQVDRRPDPGPIDRAAPGAELGRPGRGRRPAVRGEPRSRLGPRHRPDRALGPPRAGRPGRGAAADPPSRRPCAVPLRRRCLGRSPPPGRGGAVSSTAEPSRPPVAAPVQYGRRQRCRPETQT